MLELKKSEKVGLLNGGCATVIKELGRGGQGIVYLVDVNGKQMALKWYIKAEGKKFYENLEYNIHKGSPSEEFLWPRFLTKRRKKGYFGYVMDLRPEGFYELGDFMMAKKKFKSWDAIFTAAQKICDAFNKLHLKGLSYQDMNDGNFFINPENGDVLVCDNDNVAPQGQNLGIKGKDKYMAPEVVLGKTPDIYSDRFSLSVVLFILFFNNNPLEGRACHAHPCMTNECTRYHFGTNPVFIMDPKDRSNEPVKGLDANVLVRWPLLPHVLKDCFTREFSKEKMCRKPEDRLLEQEWKKVLLSARDCLVKCPACHGEAFGDAASGNCKCLCCGSSFQVNNALNIGTRRTLLLTPGTLHYLEAGKEKTIMVKADAKDKSKLYLQNLTQSGWSVTTLSGKEKIIPSKEHMPVLAGLKIKFPGNMEGEITNLK